LLSALFHDVKSSAFGHSVEYIESKEGFEHEGDLEEALNIGVKKPITPSSEDDTYIYSSTPTGGVYFGNKPYLPFILSSNELKTLERIISGKTNLGALISSDMDLDNIDNVYRLSSHIGLEVDKSVPAKLAKSLSVQDGKKSIDISELYLVREWIDTRKRLYDHLLLNPSDFSAKCMLHDSILFAKQTPVVLDWGSVDREIVENIASADQFKLEDIPVFEFSIGYSIDTYISDLTQGELPSALRESFDDHGFSFSHRVSVSSLPDGWLVADTAKNREFEIRPNSDSLEVYRRKVQVFSPSTIVERLMRGRHYGPLSLLSVTGPLDALSKLHEQIGSMRSRIEIGREVAEKLEAFPTSGRPKIRVHSILDAGKTERQVNVLDENGTERHIGKSSRKLLIGVFSANKNADIYDVENYDSSVFKTVEGAAKQVIDKAVGAEYEVRMESIPLYGEGI
jgi:hypothetical protein